MSSIYSFFTGGSQNILAVVRDRAHQEGRKEAVAAHNMVVITDILTI